MNPGTPGKAIAVKAARTEVERVCEAALRLPSSEREADLEQACGSDSGLRREVESLLQHEQSAHAHGPEQPRAREAGRGPHAGHGAARERGRSRVRRCRRRPSAESWL